MPASQKTTEHRKHTTFRPERKLEEEKHVHTQQSRDKRIAKPLAYCQVLACC